MVDPLQVLSRLPRVHARALSGVLVKPYRVVAKIKNNRLWATVQRVFPDVSNQSEAARAVGVTATEFGAILNMRRWPYDTVRDKWAVIAVKIADALKETPEYLFDPALYGRRAKPIEMELDRPALEAAGLLQLPPAPDEIAEHLEQRAAIESALTTIAPRHAEVMRRLFGLNGHDEESADAIAASLGVGPQRIHQITRIALRRLRHPARARKLAAFA